MTVCLTGLSFNWFYMYSIVVSWICGMHCCGNCSGRHGSPSPNTRPAGSSGGPVGGSSSRGSSRGGAASLRDSRHLTAQHLQQQRQGSSGSGSGSGAAGTYGGGGSSSSSRYASPSSRCGLTKTSFMRHLTTVCHRQPMHTTIML